MPHYHFNIRDHDNRLIRDEEGNELADSEAALAEATISARDLASSALREGRPIARAIEVTNESGELLFAVPLRSVIH